MKPNRIITDISDFIFVSDGPEPSDAIFPPGGSHPEQPEYAATLYCLTGTLPALLSLYDNELPPLKIM